MKPGVIAKEIEKLIEPLFVSQDEKLVQVSFTKKQKFYDLEVIIDKKGGVGIENCQKISKLIDSVDEKIDEIILSNGLSNDDSYNISVSSYGIDRPFIKDFQYDFHLGELVDVKLYSKLNNVKEFTAKLVEYKDKFIFEINGENLEIEKDKVASVREHLDF